MPAWTIREFNPSDLDDAVRVWDESHDTDARPLFSVSEVIDALTQGEPAVVASVSGRIIGTVVARVTGERAWILRIAIVRDWRGRGLGSELLHSIEDRLIRLGVRRIASILPNGEVGHTAFEHQGYRSFSDVEYVEKIEPVRPADHALLGELGAQRFGHERWNDLLGMRDAKDVIERSIVLPIEDRDLALRHGVRVPRAAILFGPPGTGKTTFAKGVAGRLGWPFVEIFPSRLAADGPHGRPAALREMFDQLAHLEHVLAFIDEVDEIAGSRAERKDTEGVVNELLKVIPVFRQQEGRLLVCATNSVRDLDPAFLRPGRFDFVIPIGPPDLQAREALLARFVRTITPSSVDVTSIAIATNLCTTADIELVARKAAQASFERAVAQQCDSPATTDDFLSAAQSVRPTITADQLQAFTEDIESYGRW